MTEMGRYMDVSICPARKVSKWLQTIFTSQWSPFVVSPSVFCSQICLKEVTLSKKEVVDQFPDRTVQVIRVNRYYSSDTSYDSSPISSDLEVGWTYKR